MKKIYKITLFVIIFIFLSTYSPKQLDSNVDENNEFFKIRNIEVFNNFIIKESKIKEKLNTIYNKNIFLVKQKDIEQPLKEIIFFKKAKVKKKYPDTVIVEIFETSPLAILKKDKASYIIDSSSNLIDFKDYSDYDLPNIFGKEAEKNFVDFFNQLRNNNFPMSLIKNYYFFQIGRWDLQLINNKTIKFPHKNTTDAIKKTIELLNRKDFENYKIIDLRVDGKIIVE